MGVAMICKTRQQWIDQARPGVAVSEKYPAMSLHDLFVKTRAECNEDYQALCAMIEAFIALGVKVDAEVKQLAQIVTVNQALGLPESDDGPDEAWERAALDEERHQDEINESGGASDSDYEEHHAYDHEGDDE